MFTDDKRIEKRQYIHRNPFTRGLVKHPGDWHWSSYKHWASGEAGAVRIESVWTYAESMRAAPEQASYKPAPVEEIDERL